jgi:hypothetical protein
MGEPLTATAQTQIQDPRITANLRGVADEPGSKIAQTVEEGATSSTR